MTLPDLNLTTINFTERSGNDDVAIQEPLFDKLIKKAPTNAKYEVDIFHFKMIEISNCGALERLYRASIR